jgi:SAM-dependent methyltransferase
MDEHLSSHWDAIYESKEDGDLTWFQASSTVSLELIELANLPTEAAIVDVGGGVSRLIDGLLAAKFENITVVDVSGAAIEKSRARLGSKGDFIRWITGDILACPLETGSVDLWHDRAVFHFLLTASDRDKYITCIRSALKPGGFVVISTFGPDGPERCSGLQICRYNPQKLAASLGPEFVLLESKPENHVTPTGAIQAFTCCIFRFEPALSFRQQKQLPK